MHRFQLTTDAFRPYTDCVEMAFGADTDYARVTPALEAGIGDHIWSLDELING